MQVEVQRIWERDSRTVAVRWNLRCFPRLLDRSLVNLDGISEYRFNDKGLIYEHKVLQNSFLVRIYYDIAGWGSVHTRIPVHFIIASLR